MGRRHFTEAPGKEGTQSGIFSNGRAKKYFQEDTADLADRHVGCYCETSGRVEALDSVGQMIRINGQVIPFADIQDIAGSMILGEEYW